MNEIKNQKSAAKTSLRFQYITASIIVVMLFLIATLVASFYFKSITHDNTRQLHIYDTLNIRVDSLRDAVWVADKSLYMVLSDAKDINQDEVRSRFFEIKSRLDEIEAIPDINDPRLKEQFQATRKAYQALNKKVMRLLELRKDINWLYPMLPFISTTLLESNRNFETALRQAVNETNEVNDKKYFKRVSPILSELQNAWRLQILDFRGSLIRFIGLNVRNISQEKDIENYHKQIMRKLKYLKKISEKGELELLTEVAVDDMLKYAEKWYQDYHKMLKIRHEKKWRSDIHFIRTEIQPLQRDLSNELGKLEKYLRQKSIQNTHIIDNVMGKIFIELWGMTAVAILFVIVIYLKLNKSILKPIEQIAENLAENTTYTENLKLPGKSGREIDVLVSAFNNMRKQVHHREMVLEFQAMHDSLTGLPNRALLQDRLEQAIHHAERNNSGISLLLLDLDRFKEINDTLGHPVGDIVLRKVSRRLEECLRATDTVARLGGDEFAILTSDTEESKINAFIERIVRKIEKVINVGDQKLYVGVSVGVASYPEHGKDADTLIQHADVAMYSAKRENRNQAFYRSDQDYYSADNLTLLADLKSELKSPSSRLSLKFQPQLDTFSGEVTTLEALLRYEHPQQGKLSAEQVIRMAEQSGLISELTQWVIKESIRQYNLLNKEKITLSINLSVWNLQDAELIPFISRTLHEQRVKPEQIVFEITESAVMNDPERSRQVLQILSEMGIGLAIDDYGTGFSSLAYLKLLPVKYLKIDKSFVVDMMEDENDAIIVRSTIDLAHNLGLSVVAEGVETQEIMAILRALGCDYVQGYYISRSLSADKVQQWFLDYAEKEIL